MEQRYADDQTTIKLLAGTLTCDKGRLTNHPAQISLIDIWQGGPANEALACRAATRGVLPSHLTLYTAFTLISTYYPGSLSLPLPLCRSNTIVLSLLVSTLLHSAVLIVRLVMFFKHVKTKTISLHWFLFNSSPLQHSRLFNFSVGHGNSFISFIAGVWFEWLFVSARCNPHTMWAEFS
jgi:hypothetical protein